MAKKRKPKSNPADNTFNSYTKEEKEEMIEQGVDVIEELEMAADGGGNACLNQLQASTALGMFYDPYYYKAVKDFIEASKSRG